MNDDSIAVKQPQPQPAAATVEPTAAPQATITTTQQSHTHYAKKHEVDTTATAISEPPTPQESTPDTTQSQIETFHLQPFGFAGDSIDSLKLSAIPPQGEGGDPTAYAASQNTAVSSVLIACFLVMIYALSQARGQIAKIVRHIMDNRYNRSMTIASLPELRYLFLLIICTAAELGLIYFNATTTSLDEEALSTLPTIGIYSAIALAYIIAKGVMYVIINWVFFSREQRGAWTDVYVTLMAALGVALLPIALAQTYLEISADTTLTLAIVAVGIQKIVSLSKAYDIFFSRSGGMLHVVPYFLTLDLLPIAALIQAWQMCQATLTTMI